MPAVEIRSLTKSYGRSRARGVVDVDLVVAAGQVLGLVGANGAGKTTLMRTLLDFVRPTTGSALVLGLDSRRSSVEVRRRTTYLPGELVFPARLTGRALVARYLSARSGMDEARVGRLAADLDVDLSRAVGELSKGNKQKLGLLLAFAPRADLLVLDEPTSGLDPLLQRQFAGLVAEAVGEGAAVLLSTHIMAEVEQVADAVALMREGRVVTVEPLVSILAAGLRRGRVRTRERADVPALAAELRTTAGVGDVEVSDDPGEAAAVVSFSLRGEVDPLIATLARHRLAAFDLGHADLEDAFFRATGGVGA